MPENLVRFKINKLIRDKIPEIIASNSAKIVSRVMDKEEYLQKLNDKLIEEALEVGDSKTKKEITEELADLFEVMLSVAKIHEIDFIEIQETSEEKKIKNGGFEGRIFADFVEMSHDNPKVSYYRSNEKKYLEIKYLEIK
jgi:predicted house-cleaning noncanonical NTP pyrophosphatase (MazG superfamily)